VLYVSYSKDKRQNQDKEVQLSTENKKEKQCNARVCDWSLAGVAGSNSAGCMDVCVVYFRGISDMRTEDIKVHSG
jgi:hypothetical protein